MVRISISLVCLLVAGASYGQTAPDLTDRTVVAYMLTADQEAQFDCSDGRTSAFWSEWSTKNAGGTLMLDYIDLTVDNNGWNRAAVSFTGSDDAEMIVRLAYGVNGLYVLNTVKDNLFMEAADLGQDACDLMIDNLSSSDIAAGLSFEMYVQPSWWTVTYTCKQFQISMGGAQLPASFGSTRSLYAGMVKK